MGNDLITLTGWHCENILYLSLAEGFEPGQCGGGCEGRVVGLGRFRLVGRNVSGQADGGQRQEAAHQGHHVQGDAVLLAAAVQREHTCNATTTESFSRKPALENRNGALIRRAQPQRRGQNNRKSQISFPATSENRDETARRSISTGKTGHDMQIERESRKVHNERG